MADTTNTDMTKTYQAMVIGPKGFTLTARGGTIEFYVGTSVDANTKGHLLQRNDSLTWRLVSGETAYMRAGDDVVAVSSEET